MENNLHVRFSVRKSITLFLLAVTLFGCVHGRVSNLPIKIDGVEGHVYVYQGRDNFAHQQTAAESMMANFCSKNHPGSSVSLLKKDVIDLGTVSFANSSTNIYGSATGTTVGNTTSIVGSGSAYTSGSATRLRNFDQRLFFQCLEADSVPLNSSNLESPNQITRQDSGNNISDLKAQLEELRDLVEEGLITEDDYTRKKAELIEELD